MGNKIYLYAEKLGGEIEEEQRVLESGYCWHTGIFKAIYPENGISPVQTPQCFPKHHGTAGLAAH